MLKNVRGFIPLLCAILPLSVSLTQESHSAAKTNQTKTKQTAGCFASGWSPAEKGGKSRTLHSAWPALHMKRGQGFTNSQSSLD